MEPLLITKTYQPDGSYTVSYLTDAEAAALLARLTVTPIPHAPACHCAKCSAERLRQTWQ